MTCRAPTPVGLTCAPDLHPHLAAHPRTTTMSYVPNTTEEQREMLRAIGAKSIEDLLAPIPKAIRLKRPLNLPAAQPERDVRRTLTALAEQNADLDHFVSFLGAGSYEHYVPSAVPHLVKRSEFYTSYTPY